MQSVWINAKLPGLNEYVNACRSNAYTGAKMKKDVEQLIAWQIIKVKPAKGAVFIRFWWYESSKRRDKDNVMSAKKFILDALQKCGKIKNDNNRYIAGLDDIIVYGEKQGVLVEIEEVAEMEYKRLTDRDVAERLKENIEGLKSKGLKPDTGDLRYVKLAEFENEQELRLGGKLKVQAMDKEVVEK